MSLLVGYIVTVIAYIIPLTLVYHFVYNRGGGIITFIFLFLMTYLIGFLASLLFYRMAILGESGKIAQMAQPTVIKIAGTTFAAYMIVGITIFAIGINRSLVKIFENTIGFSYIQLFGANSFANRIFKSPLKPMTDIKDGSNNEFNYGFLLTALNSENIQKFITYYTEGCKAEQSAQETGNAPGNLPLNFTMEFENQNQIHQLEEFIYTKHRIGHFTWVYITSILALTISFISMSMFQQ
jgi:hypothetical protein